MSDATTPAPNAKASCQTPPINRYPTTAQWREVDDYFGATLVTEDEALTATRISSSATTMPNAEVTANQGSLLGLLVKIAGARRVLEFGTLAGYSTIWLARAVGPFGCVVTCELDEGNATIAHTNLERAHVSERVEILVGPALDSVRDLIDSGTEPFDLVFIDADKPNNPAYLDATLQLTRPGSVIVVDNVVRDGAVVRSDSTDPRVRGVRATVDAIAANPHLEATAIQTVGVKGWDGFILARRTETP